MRGVTLGAVSPRIVLPPTDAEWRAAAREELDAAVEAARCAVHLLLSSTEDPGARALALAVSAALARIELAARRAML
jgi:hypothetical protein